MASSLDQAVEGGITSIGEDFAKVVVLCICALVRGILGVGIEDLS